MIFVRSLHTVCVAVLFSWLGDRCPAAVIVDPIAADSFSTQEADGTVDLNGGFGFGGPFTGSVDEFSVVNGQLVQSPGSANTLFRLLPDSLGNLAVSQGTNVFYVAYDSLVTAPDGDPTSFSGFSLFDSTGTIGSAAGEVALIGGLGNEGGGGNATGNGDVFLIAAPGDGVNNSAPSTFAVDEVTSVVARIDIGTNTLDVFLGNASNPLDISGSPTLTLTSSAPNFDLSQVDEIRVGAAGGAGQFITVDNIAFGTAVVPEPSGFAIVSCVIGSLYASRRRRTKR